jgi:hypothetical protein
MSICLAISELMSDLVTDIELFVLVRYSTRSGTTFEPSEGHAVAVVTYGET